MFTSLKAFYDSKEWKTLRNNLIIERKPKCQECGKIIKNPLDLIAHHIIELTLSNVNDFTISLNPENIKLVCHDCHDKIHKRFAYQNDREVFIVYGPPLSGKTTLVKDNMHRGDLIVDMDRLYESVSMLPIYDKPNGLLVNVRGIQDLLIDNIKTRYGKWGNAWVIGGYAEKYKREQLMNDLGAKLIFCDVSKEECLARLEIDKDRQLYKEDWCKYIETWFDRYTA